jgi:hypothetical protein
MGTLISLIAVEVGINVEGGMIWKKIVHNCRVVMCGIFFQNQ